MDKSNGYIEYYEVMKRVESIVETEQFFPLVCPVCNRKYFEIELTESNELVPTDLQNIPCNKHLFWDLTLSPSASINIFIPVQRNGAYGLLHPAFYFLPGRLN